MPSTPSSVGRLWVGVTWSGSPLLLQDIGQLEVLPPLHPHLWSHSWELPGAPVGLLPHLVWVRAVIYWATSCPSSALPSPGLVVTPALALTLSLVYSLLLPAFQASTIHWEYEVLGVLYTYQTESQMCHQTPWKR